MNRKNFLEPGPHFRYSVRPGILFFWFKCYNSLTCILFCFVDSVPGVGSPTSSMMNEHSSNEICLDHLNKSCQLSE